MKFANEQEKLKDILTQFKSEKPKRTVWGNYRLVDNTLVYTAQTTAERRCRSVEDFDRCIEGREVDEIFPGDPSVHEPVTAAKMREMFKDRTTYYRVRLRGKETNEIARKVTNLKDGTVSYLGNSSILDLIGRTVAYGNEGRNSRVTPIQTLMTSDPSFTMVPFNVFEEAGLNLDLYELVERGPEETLVIKETGEWNEEEDTFDYKSVPRHFTGASLFRVDGTTYLFDVDRREVKYKIFNPFLATIPRKVKTIKEAYLALKPKQVLAAEKSKKRVLRQGEWFFIESKAPKLRKYTDREKLLALLSTVHRGNSQVKELGKLLKRDTDKLIKTAAKLAEELPKEQALRAGDSRPNTVEKCVVLNGITYCTGRVSHSGREHADLRLKGWWMAVPNTSVKNFTVTGDVD